jgi:LemA protein
MKIKWLITGGVVLILAFLALSFGNLLWQNYSVNKNWMQLEAEYERRADLIPNLAVLLPVELDAQADAVGRLVAYRLAAIENQRRPGVRRPGRIAAVKARLDSRFILGAGHFLQDTSRFTAYMNAQHEISRVSARLVSAAAGTDSAEPDGSFGNAVRLLERSETIIDHQSQQYNKSAQNYNRSVTGFPGRWLPGLTGFYSVLEMDG